MFHWSAIEYDSSLRGTCAVRDVEVSDVRWSTTDNSILFLVEHGRSTIEYEGIAMANCQEKEEFDSDNNCWCTARSMTEGESTVPHGLMRERMGFDRWWDRHRIMLRQWYFPTESAGKCIAYPVWTSTESSNRIGCTNWWSDRIVCKRSEARERVFEYRDDREYDKESPRVVDRELSSTCRPM